MASMGVRPKVSWTLSESDVKTSAAAQISWRSAPCRASMKWCVMDGAKVAAALRNPCSRPAWGNQPAWIRCTFPARPAAAASRARYMGTGLALSTWLRRPTKSTAMSSSPMPSSRRSRARASGFGARASQSTPSGISGSRHGSETSAAKRRLRCSAQPAMTRSLMPLTARDVQTTASQGCNGAVSRPPSASMAAWSAVVWVTPHRLKARCPKCRRNHA